MRIADAIGCNVVDLYKESPNKTGVIGFVEINKEIHKVESLEDLKELVNKAEQ